MADSNINDIFADLLEDEPRHRSFLQVLQEQISDALFELHLDTGEIIPAQQPLSLESDILDQALKMAGAEQTLVSVASPGRETVFGLFLPLLNATLIGIIPDSGDSCANPIGRRFLQNSIDLTLLKQEYAALEVKNRQNVNQIEVLRLEHSEQLEESYVQFKQIRDKETELRIAYEKLQEVSRLKSEFLANTSHEIRTPINGILGMVEIALETDPGDELREILQTIQSESDSLLSIINTILDFSKLEAGKIVLEEIPFNLKVLLADLSQTFHMQAEKKGLRFSTQLSENVFPKLIGDPGRLRQILVNLVGNALKFTREGEICIKGELAEDLGNRVKIRFLVQDTGIGIPKDKHASIFDDFTQVDGSTTRLYGGTGLGTSIAKKMTILMSGEIGVESEKDQGSTFWFTVVLEKQSEQPSALPLWKKADMAGLRILLVDENAFTRQNMARNLHTCGDCHIVDVSNQKDALSALRAAARSHAFFDLAILQLHTSRQIDCELISTIRAMDDLCELPIIACASPGERGDGRMCKDLQVNGYLSSPFSTDTLIELIQSALGMTVHQQDVCVPRPITRHTLAENNDKDPEILKEEYKAEDTRKGPRILLVEDYKTNQRIALSYLSKAGFEVDLAENGQEALDAIALKRYDVVLMDIQMPVMDGEEACRRIREQESRALEVKLRNAPTAAGGRQPFGAGRIPIIAMTAHAMQGMKEQYLAAGMDDYISKPLSKAGIIAMVDKWIAILAETDQAKSEKPAGRPPEPESTPPPEQPPEQSVDVQSPEPPESPDAPMDFKKALDEFDDDSELLLEILDEFIRNVQAQVPIISQAIAEGDGDTVRAEAHSIKGGSANLTARDLSKIAFALEKAGKSGELTGSSQTLDRLVSELKRLENYAAGL